MGLRAGTGGGSLKSRLKVTIASNLLILIGVLIIMKPYLENEADIIIQDLVSGDYALGVPTVSILFSHFIIGAVTGALESVMPALPWYMIFHYLICFAALSTITYLSPKRGETWEVRLLTFAVIIYLGLECYGLPGYVKSACVTALACFFLIFTFVTDKLDKAGYIRYSAAAVVFGVISSLISFFVFFAVFCLCAVLGVIYLLINGIGDDRKSFVRSMITGIAVAAGIVSLAAAFYYIDRLHYFHDPALSASIAYRLGYEKCLSYGIPSFKFREAELEAARDAIQRLGALDPALVDTNERLLYMSQAHLGFDPHEIFNFFRFEPDNISHVPFIYLWGFLAYIFLRYGEKKCRKAAAVSAVFGLLLIFSMRMFLVLGYYRMYTLEIIPFVWFYMLFFKDVNYRPLEASSGRKTVMMLAVDVLLIVYLSFFLFDESFPLRWNGDKVYKTELLYNEDAVFDEDQLPADE